MSRLIRMDDTGHMTLASWTADDDESYAAAAAAFRADVDRGFLGIATYPDGTAQVITELARDAPNVILRRPISTEEAA